MSNWDTRSEIGLRAPTAILTNVNPVKGTGAHYGGVGPFKRTNHSDCRAIWRAWQAYHMSSANKNNYVDIAYNLGVCHHDVILEGRSTQKRPKVRGGANGNFQVNTDRMSICMIWGREDGEPPFSLKNAFMRARAFLMSEADMGSGITPHRDMSDTECPGDENTEWIRGGAKLSGKGSSPTSSVPKTTKWDGKSFPGRAAFKLGHKHGAVTVLDKRLVAHGYVNHHDGRNGYNPGPTFTEYTLRNVRDFQRDQGWRGKDADGYPGPVTWKRLMKAPKRRTVGRDFSPSRINRMAQEVIDGRHGNGHANRRKSLGVSTSVYAKVREEVNRRFGAGPGKSAKSLSQMVREVIAGEHGNGHENRRRSLGVSKSVYQQVRNEVNRRYR